MTQKRALVTGGAGFIGSHVADRLIAADYEVTIVDNFTSGRAENIPGRARFVEANVRSYMAAKLIETYKYDVVCHLAAQIDVRKSVENPLFDARVNIQGSLNLLEAIRKFSPETRIVFSSTGGALYGEFDPPPSSEGFSKDPESPYGIGKLAVEYYLAYYARVHGLNTVALRYGNVYGPRQDPHGEAGVVAIFCNRILDNRSLTVFGNGEQTRDYVYVGDVAAANVLAASAELPAAGRLDARAFNIGTGVDTSVNQLVQSLQNASGSTVPVEYAPARPGELLRSILDIRKAKEVLGWSPVVSTDEGLAETFRWFAARRAGESA